MKIENTNYYAVRVEAGNNLHGIHYIPFPDEAIELMQQEFNDTKEPEDFMYSGSCLRDYMSRYLMEKFGYDIQSDDKGDVYMSDFEPVDMEEIIHIPENPCDVDVYISIGDDECMNFTLTNAKEEVSCKENEYDGSIITCSDEECALDRLRIQIHRYCKTFPHLANRIHIDFSFYMDTWSDVVSIEKTDNVTIYHCRNSLFSFKVEVIAHEIFWYDEDTPIYKG